MLRYVEPNLQDIAHWYTILRDCATKHAFAISGNADVNVRNPPRFGRGESQALGDVSAHAF
jgi:hypothetical protein